MALSLSPLVLPIRAYASFASPGSISASASIAFSETVDLNGLGELESQQPEPISFSESATLIPGNMIGATPITWSTSADALAGGGLVGSADVAFSQSGTLIGSMLGSTTIAWSESVTLSAIVPAPLAISPLVLPIHRYQFNPDNKQPGPISGSTSIGFPSAPILIGTGSLGGEKIFADVTIDVIGPMFLWLAGTGQLLASTDVAFTTLADINAFSLFGNTAITFGTAADLTASENFIAGSADVAFDTAVTAFGTGQLVTSADVALSTAAGSTFNEAKGGLFADAIIRFETPGALRREIFASETIAFSASGTLAEGRFPLSLTTIFPARVVMTADNYLSAVSMTSRKDERVTMGPLDIIHSAGITSTSYHSATIN